MQIREIIAINVRDRRTKAGLSQKELAERGKIDEGHISRIERMEINATVETLDSIGKVLGCSVSQLTRQDTPDEVLKSLQSAEESLARAKRAYLK